MCRVSLCVWYACSVCVYVAWMHVYGVCVCDGCMLHVCVCGVCCVCRVCV